MGRTNIRSGADLLSNGSIFPQDSICVLPEASIMGVQEKTLMRSRSPSDKRDFDQYVDLFSASHRPSRWVHFTPSPSGGINHSNLPPPRQLVPQVFASVATTDYWNAGVRSANDPVPSEPSDIMYLAVIAGDCGTAVMKLLFASSSMRLGTLMLADALNGYSTVFTGACFEGEWARRSTDRATYKAVGSLKELEALRDKHRDSNGVFVTEIGILC